MSRPRKDFWSYVDVKDEDSCWPRKGKSLSEYWCAKLDGKSCKAHRVAWELTYGPIPKGKLILHRCDNKPCCNPKHLYCGTQADNMTDAMERRLTVHNCGRGKFHLKEGEIWLVRRLKAPHKWRIGNYRFPLPYVAKMFKVSPATISKIWNSDKVWCAEGKYI